MTKQFCLNYRDFELLRLKIILIFRSGLQNDFEFIENFELLEFELLEFEFLSRLIMSRNMSKTYLLMRPTKTKISLQIRRSNQRLRRPPEEILHPWLSKTRQVKILIRHRECVCLSESSLGAHDRTLRKHAYSNY